MPVAERAPTQKDLAEWRVHAALVQAGGLRGADAAALPGLLAHRLLVLLDMLEPPAVQCPNRPKVAGQILGCEPNRLARGRCIWCHKPPATKGTTR